ncbi:hypothetical protein LTS12_020820 [Elasticomyces elasticus]|nr:hypothetical protein LTS12_020820 [Elasticomyces elasticus]
MTSMVVLVNAVQGVLGDAGDHFGLPQALLKSFNPDYQLNRQTGANLVDLTQPEQYLNVDPTNRTEDDLMATLRAEQHQRDEIPYENKLVTGWSNKTGPLTHVTVISQNTTPSWNTTAGSEKSDYELAIELGARMKEADINALPLELPAADDYSRIRVPTYRAGIAAIPLAGHVEGLDGREIYLHFVSRMRKHKYKDFVNSRYFSPRTKSGGKKKKKTSVPVPELDDFDSDNDMSSSSSNQAEIVDTEDDDDVPLTKKEKALLATLEADFPPTQFEHVSDVEDDHNLVDLTLKMDHKVPDDFRLNNKLIWKLKGTPPFTCPLGRTNCNKGNYYTQEGAMQGHLISALTILRGSRSAGTSTTSSWTFSAWTLRAMPGSQASSSRPVDFRMGCHLRRLSACRCASTLEHPRQAPSQGLPAAITR